MALISGAEFRKSVHRILEENNFLRSNRSQKSRSRGDIFPVGKEVIVISRGYEAQQKKLGFDYEPLRWFEGAEAPMNGLASGQRLLGFVERGTVVEARYFRGIVPKDPDERFFVRLKLQHAREEDKFVVFDYFINSGVGEFIIESKRYDETMARNWQVGDRCQMFWQDVDDPRQGEWYAGTVVACNSVRQRRKPGSVTCPWNTISVRWDPDEEQPDAPPITTTVNAWEIEQLEEDSSDNEEGAKHNVLREQSVGRGNEATDNAQSISPGSATPAAVVHGKLLIEDPLTSGTLSNVSLFDTRIPTEEGVHEGVHEGVQEGTLKRKAVWDAADAQPMYRRVADRSSVANLSV